MLRVGESYDPHTSTHSRGPRHHLAVVPACVMESVIADGALILRKDEQVVLIQLPRDRAWHSVKYVWGSNVARIEVWRMCQCRGRERTQAPRPLLRGPGRIAGCLFSSNPLCGSVFRRFSLSLATRQRESKRMAWLQVL